MKRFGIVIAVLTVILCGIQPITHAAPLPPAQEIFLDTVAQRTWNYLRSNWATDNHLPWSWRSRRFPGGDYANPTEIGLYLLSYVGAYEMRESWSPSLNALDAELAAVLDQLRAWQDGSQPPDPNAGPNAFQNKVFYRGYWINQNPPRVGGTTLIDYNHEVPSIDNAFLAASLMTIREWAKLNSRLIEPSDELTLVKISTDILDDMDFRLWYNDTTHLFQLGGVQDPMLGVPADYYSNENRLINFVARALGDLSTQEFINSMNALAKPIGTYNGITVNKVAWDGSLFTYLAPALFLREIESDYLAETIAPAIQAQIAYADDENYSVWGLSDAYDLCDNPTPPLYRHQGARPLAPTNSDDPEQRLGLVTPHATALALITSYARDNAYNYADEAVAALRHMAGFGQLYDATYGFKDSLMALRDDSQHGDASCLYSALAQAYILLAIAEHRTGFIWKYFYLDPEVQLAHQEAPVSCSLGPSASPLSTTDNLENEVVRWGAFCDQIDPRWTKANVTISTPSGDDQALRCSIEPGGESYGRLHCYVNLKPELNAAMFTLDMNFKFSPTTCNNQGSPSTVQGLEFSMSSWRLGKRYEYAMQWENVESGPTSSGEQWRYWDGVDWRPLNPPIIACLTGDLSESAEWLTFRLEGAIVDDKVEYRNFSINSTEHLLTIEPILPIGSNEPDHLAVAFQLDANQPADAYDMLVDGVSFVRWSSLLTGLLPGDGTIIGNMRPQLRWNSLPGARRYEVQLGLTNPPDVLIYEGSANRFTPCAPLKEGEWFWRVRGIDAAGNQSPWTQPHHFTIEAPDNAAPSRNYYTSTVALTWSPTSTEYQVQINNELLPALNIASLTRPYNDGLYCWRVRAKRTNGNWGGWSRWDSFIVDAP
jgi:hypothetical protein